MLLEGNPFFKIKQLSEFDRQYNRNKITHYSFSAAWYQMTHGLVPVHSQVVGDHWYIGDLCRQISSIKQGKEIKPSA